MTDGNERWSQEQADEVASLFAELTRIEPGAPERGQIRDRIVEVHLPLLRYLARRFSGRTESFEDLVQVGAIGLLKAIDRFDPTLGHQFAAYASPTIVGELKRHLRDTGWLLRVPRRAQELQSAVAHARDELSQELGRSPAISEIAQRIDATADEVAEALDVARSQTLTSLDLPTDPDAPSGRQRVLMQDEPGFDHIEDAEAVAKALETLTEEERVVVQLRFAGGHTQSTIAGMIGVSQMQVSRILTRSVRKMRSYLDSSV